MIFLWKMISHFYRPSALFTLCELSLQGSSTSRYIRICTSEAQPSAERFFLKSSYTSYTSLFPARMTLIKAKGRSRRVLVLRPNHILHPGYTKCVLCHSVGYRVLRRHGTRRVRMAARGRFGRLSKVVSSGLPTSRDSGLLSDSN